MDWQDDPQDRAPMTEAIDTIADLRRQLENAKLSEGYAMQTVENLHKEVAELAAERDNWKEQVENPKMTYCAFCGKQYDIDDREKALEEIANHVTECEKHPYAALNAKLADLNRRLEEAQSYNKDWVGRCRKFRASDAVEAEQRLAELKAERNRLVMIHRR